MRPWIPGKQGCQGSGKTLREDGAGAVLCLGALCRWPHTDGKVAGHKICKDNSFEFNADSGYVSGLYPASGGKAGREPCRKQSFA